jgi:dihydroorotase
MSRAAQVGHCRVYPIGSITKGLEGKELSEMGDMFEAGIVAVSDDGKSVADSSVMRNALLYAKALGIPVISHSEDMQLSSGGLLNEGYYSTVSGLKGIPAAAEEIMVARDCILGEATGARLHIAHVSTAGSVRIIREAKARGVMITCEATPHHFSLTDKDASHYDTNMKVNPPLRTQRDVEAVIEGLQDGTIDAIASDHAPHTRESKEVEFAYAPCGISGIETMLPLVATKLIEPGYLDWMQAIGKLTMGPAKALGLSFSGIVEGGRADLTVIDPRTEKAVEVAKFKSKGKNSPFNGWLLKGWPVAVIYGGRLGPC